MHSLITVIITINIHINLTYGSFFNIYQGQRAIGNVTHSQATIGMIDCVSRCVNTIGCRHVNLQNDICQLLEDNYGSDILFADDTDTTALIGTYLTILLLFKLLHRLFIYSSIFSIAMYILHIGVANGQLKAFFGRVKIRSYTCLDNSFMVLKIGLHSTLFIRLFYLILVLYLREII